MTKKAEVLSPVLDDINVVGIDGGAEHILDTPFCIERTALALDEAMQMARDLKDPNMVLEVANGWLTLAAVLDPEAEHTVRTFKTGFGHHDDDE